MPKKQKHNYDNTFLWQKQQQLHFQQSSNLKASQHLQGLLCKKGWYRSNKYASKSCWSQAAVHFHCVLQAGFIDEVTELVQVQGSQSISAGRQHSSLSSLKNSCSVALCGIPHSCSANQFWVYPFSYSPSEGWAGLSQAVSLPNFVNAVTKCCLDIRYWQTSLQREPKQSLFVLQDMVTFFTMNPTMTAVLLQSGWQHWEVKSTHPPTQQIHLFAFQRNEHNLFSPKRMLFADSTHTVPHLPAP